MNSKPAQFNPHHYTDDQLWCLGLSAISVQVNGQRHDVLRHDNPAAYRKILSAWWEITSTNEYRETIDWLSNKGGRSVFNQDWGYYLTLHPENLPRLLDNLRDSDPKQYTRFKTIHHYRDVIGGRGIIAWDIARATFLARMAVTAGYIDEEEAWKTVMEYGGITRRFFDNWFEFAHSFLIGRQYSMSNLDDETGKKYLSASQYLLTNPESLWVRYPAFKTQEKETVNH
ncbi:DUF1266 domain-containing protein [Microbulbifer celer]|uniref:DUF1266 domain-containing protein n=1 Tax=Microbulbifer celer TaxID=435905 RepID=A0ABW3U5Z0_9GAMM|nr:DUF1266 domain-containing protein [Microbulbifer celer]UFN56758.1 DUF1266 domain-containing protein [Microbulbifer celer]